MSRPLRIQYPGAWYHVINRGRRREEIFKDKSDFESFIDLLEELNEVYNVKTAAYCLMSNHYHILIQTLDGNISRAMRHLNGVYTQRFNRRHRFDGQLFRGRYKSILVESDSYALELVRYIHRNPLEAGIVDNLQKYSWSSHKAYLSSAKKWKWLYKEYILKMFSDSIPEGIRSYKRFVLQETLPEINQIFSRRKLPSILGSNSFIDNIKSKFFSHKDIEFIPEVKQLAPDTERIINAVCKFYQVKRTYLFKSRRGQNNEPRNVAIYLIRYVRNDTIPEVADFFGINRCSSVGSVIARMKNGMRDNRNLKKRVEEIRSSVIKSQERT